MAGWESRGKLRYEDIKILSAYMQAVIFNTDMKGTLFLISAKTQSPALPPAGPGKIFLDSLNKIIYAINI